MYKITTQLQLKHIDWLIIGSVSDWNGGAPHASQVIHTRGGDYTDMCFWLMVTAMVSAVWWYDFVVLC